MDRPDLLAMSYVRNVAALRRMSAFAHRAAGETSEDGWERPALRGYEPLVRWNRTPGENLEAVSDATGGLTDLGRLKDAVNGLRPQVEAHFDPADLVDHDSPMLNYSFAAMPDDPGDRDVDHPAALLLREAQNDLAQAVNLMDWHRYDETLEEARAAVLAGKSPDAVLTALEENGACAEVRHSVEDNLKENGGKLTEEEREKIVMQIMDRLTHADFCITMAPCARVQDA
jgi:hypothetical protein